ncbi:hypothetical protein M513_06439 [Trichuris suis]|uniref:Uncharacterized protein n=1 Tax=Trichuris suis TaxID=68888 RepID=A0A085M5U6_9BILA|nr:hypothetical protein M513_06439 [Trichuris suis]
MPGVVYEIKCECPACYTGEMGNTFDQRLRELMRSLNQYRNAEDRLNRESTVQPHGRPSSLEPEESMEQAVQTSAVT